MTIGAFGCASEAIEQTSNPGAGWPYRRRARTEQDPCAAHAWAQAFHSLRGDASNTHEEREADQERIACLEAIIVVLLEKNERFRQQLMESMQ